MDTKENKIKMENEKNNKKNKLVSVIQNILIIIPVIMFLYAITIGVLKFGFKMRGIDGTSMQPTFIGDGKEYTFFGYNRDMKKAPNGRNY